MQIEVYPSQLCLPRKAEPREFQTLKFTIRPPADAEGCLAVFKISTAVPRRFSVRPPSGVVEFVRNKDGLSGTCEVAIALREASLGNNDQFVAKFQMLDQEKSAQLRDTLSSSGFNDARAAFDKRLSSVCCYIPAVVARDQNADVKPQPSRALIDEVDELKSRLAEAESQCSIEEEHCDALTVQFELVTTRLKNVKPQQTRRSAWLMWIAASVVTVFVAVGLSS